MINRFKALFHGLDRAYGQWMALGPKTVRGAAPDIVWQNHLDGKIGIGVVPIQDGNMCEFGAIDIDIKTIDHKALALKIQEKSLPLIVCKSKRNGAHCYTFTAPVKASIMRMKLSRYAAALSHGKAEIFPKQDELASADDIGNWINLPYFSNTRQCVDADGNILTLVEFLDKAEALKAANDLTIQVGTDEMPPCLQYFMDQGASEGARNEILYQFGVFFKKSNPGNWEDDILQTNYKIFDTPLPNKEVQSMIKSLARKEYRYKCKVPPFSDLCDALTCKTLPYGIDDTGMDSSKYGELLIGSISKIMTNPPRWIIEINGIDLECTTEEIMDYRRVRVLCMEKIDMIAPPMKMEDWLKILKGKIADKRVIEAPADANQHGQLQQALLEFLQMASRAKTREDLLRGIPVSTSIVVKTYNEIENIDVESTQQGIVFRSYDFLGYMRRKKLNTNLSGPALWMELRRYGCDHTKIRVGHRTVQVWYMLTPKDEESVSPRVERIINNIEDSEV